MRRRTPTPALDFIRELWFIFDIYISFGLGYEDPEAPELVMDTATIRKTYLRGWFPLDIMSIAASLFDVLPIALASSGDSKQVRSLTVLRVVRILRLIKLLRLLKASKLLKSWAVKIPTPRATRRTSASSTRTTQPTRGRGASRRHRDPVFVSSLAAGPVAVAPPRDLWRSRALDHIAAKRQHVVCGDVEEVALRCHDL